MFDRGFLKLATIRGAPIRIHASVILGALFFTGFRIEPAAWLGFVLLVLIHELGHATLVLRYRLRVVSVDVHGFGGLCRWEGVSTEWQRAVIAWGGVLAQGLLYAATWGALRLIGPPTTLFGAELASVFLHTNLYLALINLLPVPPLDGSNAWSIFRAFRSRRSPRVPPEVARERAAREIRELDARARGTSLSARDEERLRRLFEDASRQR